jgi:hypothetical protein
MKECSAHCGVLHRQTSGGSSVNPQEKRMNKFAIRLLTLAVYVAAAAAVPMIVPSKAAAETSKATKKHKAAKTSGTTQSRSTEQAPPNMADDPSRKISY